MPANFILRSETVCCALTVLIFVLALLNRALAVLICVLAVLTRVLADASTKTLPPTVSLMPVY